jgi:predicted dehydrogenase
MYAICRRDTKGLNEAGDKYNIPVRYTDYQQVLDDSNIDAVHINSPIPDHGWMSVAALKAGKHVACTVPMGTSVEECHAIVEAQRASGKTYMMMETVVYSREYLYVKDLYDKGVLGRLQFLRRLAELLAGTASDVVRHSLRQPLPGDSLGTGQACFG